MQTQKILFLLACLVHLQLFSTQQYLDSSFGANQNGIVNLIVNQASTAAYELELQPDEKIVVTGYTTNNSGNNQVILARYTTGGILDTTFGSSGITTSAIGDSSTGLGVKGQSDLTSPSAPFIVVTGQTLTSGTSSLFVARYTNDGILDTTFGTAGVTTWTTADGASSSSLAVQSTDQYIVVAGSVTTAGLPTALVARFTDTGALDGTFGSGGIVTITSGIRSNLIDVKLQSDGKIVAVGYSAPTSLDDHYFIVRLNTDGSLDGTFGTGGITTVSFTDSNKDIALGLEIQTDGKIIVVGNSRVNGLSVASATRLNTNGSIDTTFGTSGFSMAPMGSDTWATDLVLQPDGKFVVVGSGNSNLAAVRFNVPSAIPDSTFGASGLVETDLGTVSLNYDVVLQSDGKLVAAGISDKQAVVVRYLANNSNFVSILSPANGSTISSLPFTISGNASQRNCTIYLSIDSIAVGTTTTDSNGNWTFTQDQLANGAHTISASLACTTSPLTTLATTSNSVTVSVPDSITISSASCTTVYTTSTPTFSGNSSEASAPVRISIDGSVVATVTTNALGDWQYTSSYLPNGSHTLLVELRGGSPLTTLATDTCNFLIDAPSKTIIGKVTSTGTITGGNGFSASALGSTITITFATAFATSPIVVATGQGLTSPATVRITALSASAVDLTYTSGTSQVHFIATQLPT